jgi:hypothetical protein
MTNPIFYMRAAAKISGTQKPNWWMRLGLFEEQLSTVVPNSALEVGNEVSFYTSWDSA